MQRFKFFCCWEGYCAAKEIKQGKPGFRVRSKTFGILRGGSPFKAVVGLDKNQPCQIKIEKRTSSNSTCKIVDELGLLVAEVRWSIHLHVFRWIKLITIIVYIDITSFIYHHALWAGKEKNIEVWSCVGRWCFDNGGGALYWSLSRHGTSCCIWSYQPQNVTPYICIQLLL